MLLHVFCAWKRAFKIFSIKYISSVKNSAEIILRLKLGLKITLSAWIKKNKMQNANQNVKWKQKDGERNNVDAGKNDNNFKHDWIHFLIPRPLFFLKNLFKCVSFYWTEDIIPQIWNLLKLLNSDTIFKQITFESTLLSYSTMWNFKFYELFKFKIKLQWTRN